MTVLQYHGLEYAVKQHNWTVGGQKRLAVCLEQQWCLCAVPYVLKVQRALHKPSFGCKMQKQKNWLALVAGRKTAIYGSIYICIYKTYGSLDRSDHILPENI